MLRCLMDPSVPENSDCAKCCMHCKENKTCEYRCPGIECWKTEEEIAGNCIHCLDEEEEE